MFTLYWEYMAGSIVVQATLEALDADYRMQYVDMGAEEHLAPDFLQLNPAGVNGGGKTSHRAAQ